MNPLKLYVYYALGVKIVTSKIANIEEISESIYIAESHKDFVKCIEKALQTENTLKSKALLNQVDWRTRVQNIINLVNTKSNNHILSRKSKEWKLAENSIPQSSSSDKIQANEYLDSSEKIISVPQVTKEKNMNISYRADNYEGICSICGLKQIFRKEHSSFREGYQCSQCKSSLRYRGQADAILNKFSRNGSVSIKDLCQENEFKNISIYEPGVIGPFRKYFNNFKNYVTSFYWSDVKEGEYRDGLQCQNLEQLTYISNRFDLILTSDIIEHIRKPWDAFQEIWRILKLGGYHIFTIPVHYPMRSKTFYRVDTSGSKDIHLIEPRYHSAPNHDGTGRGKSLVYVDFGKDIIAQLSEIGFEVELLSPQEESHESEKLITFVTKKV
jgi:SAM-dependent methyltransferase/arsenate reductase-like glutaredoxin family protein